MYLQVELARVQDDREPAARALRGGQERDRLFGQWLGAIREAEPPDEFIAGGLPATT
jgi:hypothetical protein